jgi:1-acyl-sn-glycerol-3-phosphate acyltransferase
MPVSFVAKQELSAHAFAGPLLRRLGAVFVERFDARQGVDDVRRLAETTGERPLFFFAEGTFTRQPGLRPFRLGAFQIAVQNRLAVVPVALSGTREILRDESWLPRRAAVQITFCAPITPTGEGWQAALQLREATRREILKRVAANPTWRSAGHPGPVRSGVCSAAVEFLPQHRRQHRHRHAAKGKQ